MSIFAFGVELLNF